MKTALLILGFFALGFIHQCKNNYPPVPDGDKEIEQIKCELEAIKAETKLQIDSVRAATVVLDSMIDLKDKKTIKRLKKVEKECNDKPVKKMDTQPSWLKGLFTKKTK